MGKMGLVVLIVAFAVLGALVYLILIQPVDKGNSSDAGDSFKITALRDEDIKQKRDLAWKDYQQGNIKSAILAIEEYIELVPDDIRMRTTLAECCRIDGDLAKAESAANKALELDPKYIEGLRVMASICRAKSVEFPQLREEYLSKAQLKIEEALSMTPDDARTQESAAYIYFAQGNAEEALESIDKAIALEHWDKKRFLLFKERILNSSK